MASGLWRKWQPGKETVIECWPGSLGRLDLPSSCEVREWSGSEGYCKESMGSYDLVLLAGDTPVNEMLGLGWPLEALREPLTAAHAAGVPVIAVGVGIDLLHSPAARDIFARAYKPIRAWSVRSRACRRALVEMGIERGNIILAADLAWLYQPRNLDLEAGQLLEGIGLQSGTPFLAVNVVNEKWASAENFQLRIAQALDNVARNWRLPIVFIPNELRQEDFYDTAAAAKIGGMMRERNFVIRNRELNPDLVIAILRRAAGVVAQRYHFAIEAVLAGQNPVVFQRGQKLCGLINDLGLLHCGEMGRPFPVEKLLFLLETAGRRSNRLALALRAAFLRRRAGRNISLLNSFILEN